ncbi:hypothetical protein OEZ86_010645 [Tetradesmus obliquus]|nr:hypothetical protein OEZ86_010645 [Tetradesmus obliquus]
MECESSQPSTARGVDYGKHGRPLLSIAPMMEWTDVHYRQLARLLSKHTWLWTEMVVDKTIIHTPLLDKHLWFPPEQHPIVLQLGGSDPALLLQAAKVAATYGYDEINLNCGCPSDRVAGAGCFGAALMLQPELVADCMAAIQQGLGHSTPVSVKIRLGVDDDDSYEQLANFVRVVSERGGVSRFVIHSRKCLLRGLSPSQNRSVPPLRPDWVWALKRDFPHLSFQLNGGVLSSYAVNAAINIDGSAQHAALGPGSIDGVMVGRAGYNDPWGVLSDADVAVFGAASNPAVSRRQVIADYCKYADGIVGRWQVKDDGYHDPNIRVLVRPILNLFHGDRGGKKWKNAVDGALKAGGLASFSDLMAKTLGEIPDEVLDAPPRSSREAALILGNGELHPCFDALPGVLAQPGDRARADNERRRGGSSPTRKELRKEQRRQQQQHQVDAVAEAAAAAEQQRRQQELLQGSCCG